jgi:hypothetical protein
VQASKPDGSSIDIARLQNSDSAMVFMFGVSMAASLLAAFVVFAVTKRQNEASGYVTAPVVIVEPQPAWPTA